MAWCLCMGGACEKRVEMPECVCVCVGGYVHILGLLLLTWNSACDPGCLHSNAAHGRASVAVRLDKYHHAVVRDARALQPDDAPFV